MLAPGTLHASDAVALQAQSETTTAYNLLAGLAVTATLTGQDLGGLTLVPGVYFFANAAQLTGTLTLDGQGDPNATFVFQIGSTLTTASSSSVAFINGAASQEVYWQVGSSATLGTATQFAGNIVALSSITFGTGASIACGRALARNGAVTLDTNRIVNDCANTPGSISGRKFEDLNGDGIEQPGEPGLSGVTVYLDANGNNLLDFGETTAISDINGSYSFANLAPGTYAVREARRADLLQTTPEPSAITLAPGQNVIDIAFGDFRLVSFGGLKFNDLNGNGIRDAGDPGVAGVTIFLDTNGNGTRDAGEVGTVTDASGSFTFDNVGPGSYRIREVQPPGTVRTSANPADIVASSGSNVGGVLIGNFGLFSAQPVPPLPPPTPLAVLPPLPPLPPFSTVPPGMDVGKRMFLASTSDTTPPASVAIGRTVPDFAALGSVSTIRRPTFVATAEGAGGDLVRVFDLTSGQERFRFRPFPGNPGGVQVATADLTGDGIPDIVVGAGPGGTPRVIGYDGNSGRVLFDFLAFEASFSGGVYLAAGDLNRDGRADLVVTADVGGGPRVRVLDGGDTGRVLADFWGIADPAYRGGTRPAVADLNADGALDLIVGAGTGGGPRIAVFDGLSIGAGQMPTRLFSDFFALDKGLRYGVYLTVGDVDGDGITNLIVGAGPGGGPRIVGFDAQALQSGTPAASFSFFVGDASDRGGVPVRAIDVDGDGRTEVMAGAGLGHLPRVRFFDPRTAVILDEFSAQYPEFLGGIQVG